MRALRHLAIDLGEPMAEILETAIQDFLKKHKAKKGKPKK